jgi:hypothetical protein
MGEKTTGCGSALKYLTRKNKADMILGFSSVRADEPRPLDIDKAG